MYIAALILSALIGLLALGYLVSVFVPFDDAPDGWDEPPQK
jgi:hypothetical protein